MSNSFATPWTVPCQVPLSMGLSRQEYWSGLPFPSQGDLPNSGIQQGLLHWQMDSLPLSHLGSQKCDIYIGHKNICIYLSIKSIIFHNNEKNPLHSHMCACSFSRVWLFATPWTVVCQAPLSTGFSKQECWSGLHVIRGSSQHRNWTCIGRLFFATVSPRKPFPLTPRCESWWCSYFAKRKPFPSLLSSSVLSNSVTPWTIAHPEPLSMGILQAGRLERITKALIQGIFPTQGSNPGLLHCKRIL